MPSQEPSVSLQPSDMPSPEFGDVNITVPNRIEYHEDDPFDISSFVDYVDRIPRNDEAVFLEIDLTDAPEGTVIRLNGTVIDQNDPINVDGVWLKIPVDANLTTLTVENYRYYSGTYNISVRGTLRENGVAVSNSTEEIVIVDVIPKADCIGRSNRVRVPEDAGNITWGYSFFDDGFRAEDFAQEVDLGNNPLSERFIEIQITIPAPSLNTTPPFEITVEDDRFRSVPSDPTSTTPGIGNATISLEESTSGSKVYTIRSALLPNGTSSTEPDVLSLTDEELIQLETDILDTARELVISISPEHTDANPSIAVAAATVDVNRFVRDGAGVADISTQCNRNDLLIVDAVADQPSIDIIEPNLPAVLEDTDNIPLCFQVSPSADNTTIDNSEVLSVQISIPTVPSGFPIPIGTIEFIGTPPDGVTFDTTQKGIVLIEADPVGSDPESRAALLNSVLCNASFVFNPRFGYGGNDDLTVNVIATERNGGDQASAQGIITLNVTKVADVANVTVKGNAIGLEDTNISVEIEATLNDPDGSENFVLLVNQTSVPNGAKIFGAGGQEILPMNGVYTLQPEDVLAFVLQPPLDFSTALLDEDIVLDTTTIVTDGTDTTQIDLQINIRVRGVADKPPTRSILVEGLEDEIYDLGTPLQSQLANVLVDTDGSEVLSFRLKGLPKGLLPTSNVTDDGAILYLGEAWQIREDALPGLKIPPRSNYAGEDPYPGLQIFAVTQEVDGNQAISDPWEIEFDILPVVDGASSWLPGDTVEEGDNDNDSIQKGVSLEAIDAFNFIDGVDIRENVAETALTVEYDLSNLIDDAKIGVQLNKLLNQTNAGIQELVDNYLFGDFVSFNATTGILVATRAQIAAGLRLGAALFFQSNVGFSIPVTIFIQDRAVINGVNVTDFANYTGSFDVILEGSADPPTVFADNASGLSLTPIPVNLGGASTDNDIELGRNASETLYFIVTELNSTNMPFEYTFINSNTSEILGNDRGGAWFLSAEDVQNNLAILTPQNYNGTLEFSLTAVVTENDGDTTFNTTGPFFVEFLANPDNSTASDETPGVPTLELGLIIDGENIGGEDGVVILSLNATEAGGPGADPTNPVVTVTITDIPDDFRIEGNVIFNPLTGEYSASAEDITAGNVRILPPQDFGGTFTLTVEAVATSKLSTTSGTQTLTGFVDPSAIGDGVAITAGPSSGFEDTNVPFSVSFGFNDADQSERIVTGLYNSTGGVAGAWWYIRWDYTFATFVFPYTFVLPGDSDEIIFGTNLTGYYRIPISDTDLVMQLLQNWHGTITGDIRVPVIENTTFAELGADLTDDFILSSRTFTIDIAAVVDEAILTVPNFTVTADQDTTFLIPDLSAILFDNVTENGAEVLSAVIRNVPDDTLFSAGVNQGFGTWVIPVNDLSSLQITPPPYYAGLMNLTLVGITYESSNFDETEVGEPFLIELAPVADNFLILAKDVEFDPAANIAGPALADPSLRMLDQTGTNPGEIPPEYVEFTYTDIPAGYRFVPLSGGRLIESIGGATFIGTPAQANSLTLVTGPGTIADTNFITLSAVSVDGNSTSAPVVDNFRVRSFSADTTSRSVTTPNATSGEFEGGPGNDIIESGAGDDVLLGGDGNDLLIGGAGGDTMTGGPGVDIFKWKAPGDLGNSTDRITDFTLVDDILSVSEVLASIPLDYDPQFFDITQFLTLVDDGTNSTILVPGLAIPNELVVLEGVTGVTIQELFDNGNILL